ncbi:hypothetical protein D3C86_1491170 [compost metagenome]
MNMTLVRLTRRMCGEQQQLQRMAAFERQSLAAGHPPHVVAAALEPDRQDRRRVLAYGAQLLQQEFPAANDVAFQPAPETA